MGRRCCRATILSLMLVMEMGCVWHGESADHLWGPTLFRIATPPDSQAFLAEQAWLPLLVEGGNRWGITIGYFSNLLSVPWPSDRQMELRVKTTLSPGHPSLRSPSAPGGSVRFMHRSNERMRPNLWRNEWWAFNSQPRSTGKDRTLHSAPHARAGSGHTLMRSISWSFQATGRLRLAFWSAMPSRMNPLSPAYRR